MKIIFIILLTKLVMSQETTSATTESTTEEPHHRYCHTCEGNINTDPCSYYQPVNVSSFLGTEETRCEHNTEECYTSVQDGVVRRGCIGDGYCDTHECETCKYMYCNDDNKATMFCLSCNSLPKYAGYDENCKNNPEDVIPISCIHTAYKLEDRGCYSMHGNETRDGVTTPYVSRGCIGYIIRYERCYDDEDDTCFLCMEDGCNTQDMSFSAKHHPITILKILSLCLLTYKLYQ